MTVSENKDYSFVSRYSFIFARVAISPDGMNGDALSPTASWRYKSSAIAGGERICPVSEQVFQEQVQASHDKRLFEIAADAEFLA
jgi:hypothetical protein